MAQSRLERIGTIFTRITSLVKGGALKPDEKPMWYIIYEAFPPKTEPRFDKPAPNIDIKEIFYKEDIIRAKFQKEHGQSFLHNLGRNDRQSHTLQFIEIYQNLEKLPGISEAECYDKALKELSEKYPKYNLKPKEILSNEPSQPISLDEKKTSQSVNTSGTLET